MKILFVGGNFGNKPKESKIVRTLSNGLANKVLNGGSLDDLKEILNCITKYDVVVWMPNISNNVEKFLLQIKEKHPHIILISSKRNDGKYTLLDLVNRALVSKSQVLIEFHTEDGIRLVDALGNTSEYFSYNNEDILKLQEKLAERIKILSATYRIGTTNVKVEEKFLDAIKKYANVFSDLTFGGDSDNPRFMGNASFRCTKGGFPSFKRDGMLYVSKRNVNKSTIIADDFVPVHPELLDDGKVQYEGKYKPSVDTPIQVLIYQYLPKINYLLHAHIYHKNGIFTKNYVPCGDLREAEEIKYVLPSKNRYILEEFVINLKGHGCLIGSLNLDFMLNQENNFYRRPFPEVIL